VRARAILRSAHGTAKAHGAVLVAEMTPLDEMSPANAASTVTAIVVREREGKPFQEGNAAGAGRGSSLERIEIDPEPAPGTSESAWAATRRNVRRRASHLQCKRRRELELLYGYDHVVKVVRRVPDGQHCSRRDGSLKCKPGCLGCLHKREELARGETGKPRVVKAVSSGVKVEIVAWALATAWADYFESTGEDGVLNATAFREKASGFDLKALGKAQQEDRARPRAPWDPIAHLASLPGVKPTNGTP
jgi:hypothetical protein